MFSFILLLTIILLFITYYLVSFIRFLYWFNKLPGEWAPLHLQIFGMALKVMGKNEAERWNVLRTYAPKYAAKCAKLWIGHMFILVVHDPEILQKIFSSKSPGTLEKPFFYKFLGFGDGLLTSKVKLWRPHRKILNNAFTLKSRQSFVPVFERSSKNVVKDLQKHVDQKEFEIVPYIVKTTMANVCSTSFGISVKDDQLLEFNENMQINHELTALRMFNVLVYPDIFYRLTKHWKESVRVQANCNKFGDELVQKRREVLSKLTENNNYTNDDDGLHKRCDILVDHLIRTEDSNGQPMFSDEEIRDHALTTLSAAHITTALAVSMCLMYLSIHQQHQDRVYEEISYLENKEITLQSVLELEFLDMVIKETLRLAPSVPVTAREIAEDVDLDGLFIPKGTQTLTSLGILHRLEYIWGPDAEKFNPDNFLPENVAQRHPFAYLPFSAGIRNCIGQKYAMLSMKIMLVHLLSAYKFETSLKEEDIKFRADVHFMMTQPYLLRITRRQQQPTI